ncbi:hypothetical protein C8R45DRAFT_1087981 [Mycena sanguinolenta]|nr:hypothetical protein C8R45DRAFT_1087981 [Mycena sanguinolenta]
MACAGTAARRRAREGKSPVKPGVPGWVHGTKLAFFSAHKIDYLAAVETGKTGPFYTSIGQLYVGVYGYNTPWDGDLPDGQDVADDVNPDEDVDSLAPEEAAARAEYFKTLRRKIGVWYNNEYGGGQKKKKVTKTFKQLFDKRELEPPAPVKSRVLHFYSCHFYEERIKPRVMTCWVALSRLSNAPMLITVHNAVTKEAWEAETQEFRDEVIAANQKEHETACEAYKIVMAKEVPTTGEEFSMYVVALMCWVEELTFANALNNSGHYLQPFADAIRAQYGMNVAILLCGPIPEHGGRIEVRSIHAGFSNGLVPRIWSDFDRTGFDSAQRSFISFTQNCFTEEECQVRALSNKTLQATQPDAPLPPTSFSIGPSSSPLPPTLSLAGPASSSSSGSSDDPPQRLLPPATQSDSDDEDPPLRLLPPAMQSLMPGPGANEAWDALLKDCLPGGWNGSEEDMAPWGGDWGLGEGYTGPVVREALGREIAMMTPGENLAYMARLAGMSREEVEQENELAVRRAGEWQETLLRPPTLGAVVVGTAAPANAANPTVGVSTPTVRTTAGINAATIPPAQATPENEANLRPKPKPAWRSVQAVGTGPDAEGDNNGGEKGSDEQREGEKDGSEKNVDENDAERVERESDGEASNEDAWQQPDKDVWPQELRVAFRAMERRRKFGGEVWKTCAERLIAFERMSGFPEKGQLSVPAGTDEQHPQEVPAFIKRARKWERQMPLASSLGPATESGSFAERWWKWWVRVQPDARTKENGKMGSVTLVPEDEWEEVSKMAGKNGLLMYVGALLWWGEAAAGAGEGADELLVDWKVAVADVVDVLAMVTKKRSSSDGDENDQGGAGVGRKRKERGDASSTGGKENNNPRKRHQKSV